MNTPYLPWARRCLLVGLMIASLSVAAQHPADSIAHPSLLKTDAEMVGAQDDSMRIDPDFQTLEQGKTVKQKQKRDWATWKPNPKRAMWLALVMPGAGQIYNRKYWKLPIFYGGFVGCAYAMRWNNMMYRDYSQAYLDIMDDDPATQSYNQFLHLGNQVTPNNMERWQEIFRKRKDRYRRWRDMSFFVIIGVYALSVVDAYVDASLSEFDISPDLSLRISPTILNNNLNPSFSKHPAFGLQCSIEF